MPVRAFGLIGRKRKYAAARIARTTNETSQGMIEYPSSRRNGPKYPRSPKISTNMSPATTGDTAKGRSIKARSRPRPGKAKRAIAHAAATPKITLATSAMGTTVSVIRIEWRVSASSNR